MFQRHNDFGNVDAHLVFGKFLPLIKMREELTAAHVICALQKHNEPEWVDCHEPEEIKVDDKKKKKREKGHSAANSSDNGYV